MKFSISARRLGDERQQIDDERSHPDAVRSAA
jgi:hypothetical protein